MVKSEKRVEGPEYNYPDAQQGNRAKLTKAGAKSPGLKK